MKPIVSVVIPTYNRRARLERMLEALARQVTGTVPFEVIVVSDGSSDGTREYLECGRTPLDVVAAFQTNAGPAAARNRGVEMAQADLVLFVDDDVLAAPNLIGEHARSHREHGAGVVVIGPMLTPDDHVMSPWVRWEQAMLYKQYDAVRRGDWSPTFRQFYTGNSSLARSAVLDVGGFDTRFRRAEDVELAYRLHLAGQRFIFDPAAIGFHYAERAFDSWLQNARDYGANDVVFAREFGAKFSRRMRNEYRSRNPLLRGATRLGVAWPRFAAATERVLSGSARLTEAIHAENLTHAMLSGLYNTAYYRGVVGALGDPDEFRQLIKG